MKLKQSVNLLLIALFVLAFQSTTIHFQHHEIEEMAECSVCHTSEHLDLSHHHSSIVIVNEHLAVKTRKDVEKVVVNPRFDYAAVLSFNKLAIVQYRSHSVQPIPLGYYTTAPPYIFS